MANTGAEDQAWPPHYRDGIFRDRRIKGDADTCMTLRMFQLANWARVGLPGRGRRAAELDKCQ